MVVPRVSDLRDLWREQQARMKLKAEGLDPDFGYMEIGDTAAYWGGGWLQGFRPFACPEIGTAQSINSYVIKFNASSKVRYALYKDSDDSLIGYTEEGTLPTDWAWLSLDIVSEGSLEATDYILAILPEGDFGIRYNAIANFKRATRPLDYNSFPDPAGWWGKDSDPEDRKYSIYCSYTPLEHILTVQSTPTTGVPVTIDGVEVGATPVSRTVPTGNYKVAAPSEVEVQKWLKRKK